MADFTAEEVSALSGRMVAPGVPPKSAKEAKAHRKQIEALRQQLRKRMEAEAIKKKTERVRMETSAKRWEAVMVDFDAACKNPSTAELFKCGVPPHYRGEVWGMAVGNALEITQEMYEVCAMKALTRNPADCPASPMGKELDQDFFSPITGKYETASLIEVDLHRTVVASQPQQSATLSPRRRKSTPLHSPPRSPRGASHSPPHSPRSDDGVTFTQTEMMEKLNLLLRAFVEYRPDVGYVQGMSYIAAMLLIHMEPPEAFVALANMLAVNHFPSFYTVNPDGMGRYLAVFDEVLAIGCPDINRHFRVIGVRGQMFVMDWWMSLFSRVLPYDIAARCWDLYILDITYLFRISLAVIWYFEDQFTEDSEVDTVMSLLTKLRKEDICEERFFALVLGQRRPHEREIRDIMSRHTSCSGHQ